MLFSTWIEAIAPPGGPRHVAGCELCDARAAVLVLLGGWMEAAPAAAEAGPGARAERERCEGWLPDLRCGRSGRFFGMRKPIVQPYLFEDPFVTTGITPYYVWHEFPEDSALQGGDIHVAAAQIRVALTERVALVATKDGYAWRRPDNPLLDDTQGWFNLTGGVKVALAGDAESGYLISGILRVEAPREATTPSRARATAWRFRRWPPPGTWGASI